jgi:hypothetical protein
MLGRLRSVSTCVSGALPRPRSELQLKTNDQICSREQMKAYIKRRQKTSKDIKTLQWSLQSSVKHSVVLPTAYTCLITLLPGIVFRSTSEKTKGMIRNVPKFKSPFERMSQECPPESMSFIVQPGLTAVETKHLERPKCFQSPEATYGQLALSRAPLDVFRMPAYHHLQVIYESSTAHLRVIYDLNKSSTI